MLNEAQYWLMVIERSRSEDPCRFLRGILSQAATQKFPVGSTGHLYCFDGMSKLLAHYDKFGTSIRVMA
jgi:hypothetical protein